MARIEKNQEVQKEVKEMRGEMVKTVKMSNPKRKAALGCLIGLIVVVGLVGFLALWVFAQTGLVRIPVVSTLAYQAPKPIRFVDSGIPLETHLSNELNTAIGNKLIEGGGEIKDNNVSIRIPEESITTTLRSLIEESGVSEIESTGSQIIIDPEIGLEIFLPLSDNEQKSAFVFHVTITTTNEEVDIKVDDVWIGSLHIPGFISRAIFDPVIESNLGQINTEVGKYAKVKKIDYQEGVLILAGQLAVEILEINPL